MLGYHTPPPPEQTPPGADPPEQTPWEQAPPRAGTPPPKQTPAYGQWAAGTHPTGMHSCLLILWHSLCLGYLHLFTDTMMSLCVGYQRLFTDIMTSLCLEYQRLFTDIMMSLCLGYLHLFTDIMMSLCLGYQRLFTDIMTSLCLGYLHFFTDIMMSLCLGYLRLFTPRTGVYSTCTVSAVDVKMLPTSPSASRWVCRLYCCWLRMDSNSWWLIQTELKRDREEWVTFTLQLMWEL